MRCSSCQKDKTTRFRKGICEACYKRNLSPEQKAKIRAAKAIWRAKNRDRVNEQKRVGYDKNKQKIREQQRLLYGNSKDKWNAARREKRFREPELCRENQSNWRENNKDKIAMMSARYRAKHPVKIKESHKKWRQKNLVYMRAYRQKTMRGNVLFRLGVQLRIRLNVALKRNQRVGSAVRDLGCSVEFLKQHIESQFQVGMTWDNWGLGEGKWQIDHIKPLCSFDLTKREQFLEACNYINLQPLWHRDHVNKTRKDISEKNSNREPLCG